MSPTDQTLKLRLVFLIALLALIGFALEIGPVGGVFSLALIGLAVELPALGFLGYLALAASAAVGLHLGEVEPTPQEEEDEQEHEEKPTVAKPTREGAAVGVRTRPELHQLRMAFTALGGYALLKGLSLFLMWQMAGIFPRYRGEITADALIRAFQFGLFFVALSWFVMWQFLRWYAQERRWIRLQYELIGADIATSVIGAIMLWKPLSFLVEEILQPRATGVTGLLTALLYLAVAVGALFVWASRPTNLRRTIVGLFAVGGAILLLTILLILVEWQLVMGGA